jgi:hypothetical protein
LVGLPSTPVNGSVILALLNDQFIVKRFCITQDGILSGNSLPATGFNCDWDFVIVCSFGCPVGHIT